MGIARTPAVAALVAVTSVATMWAEGCASASAPGHEAQATDLSGALDASPAASGCADDAASFVPRASCVYGIPSDAATLSACDEWSQGLDGNWDSFAESCANQRGGLAVTPCAPAGNVGHCTFVPTCDGARVTYYFGDAGVASFQQECTAVAGAVWSAGE